MRLEDAFNGIMIDDEFPCSSAGEMRLLAPGSYEVGFQPEEIPQWFQDLLNDLFKGKGVPKEYMAHVRVRNTGSEPQRVTLRFLLSPKGASYTYPPWWLWREDRGWTWLPTEDTDYHPREYMDATLELRPGESVRIASAPYEEPDAVIERMQGLADRYDMWSYREIGTTAQGRPLAVLETEPRDIKLLVDSTMQSSEPVSWGILHVAHWLTIPTTRARQLLERVQFSLMPLMNPDGVYVGHSVTNAVGEVPKFGINHLVEGKGAPKETEALWKYMLEMRPDAGVEVHSHFTRDDFKRSVVMQDNASLPEHLQGKAAIIEQAIFENFHAEPLDNRKVLIDHRMPEHAVYGDQHLIERVGTIRTSVQSVADSIESQCADVREMVETVATALIQWKDQ